MMDINKILTLLGTTSDEELRVVGRALSPARVSATESANDILNRELFGGTSEPALPAAPRASKPAVAKKPKHTAGALRKRLEGRASEPPATRSKGKKVLAEESVINTEDSSFPEEFVFDEEKFADEYGLEVDTISIIYQEESEDGKEPEHLELSFNHDESAVVLKIFADGTIEETVDGEFIDPPQFSFTIEDTEAEDGSDQKELILNLIDEEPEGEPIEEPEGEPIEEPIEEPAQEFIDNGGGGIRNDEYYATAHSMNTTRNPANRIDYRRGTSRPEPASESLAAKTARRSAGRRAKR